MTSLFDRLASAFVAPRGAESRPLPSAGGSRAGGGERPGDGSRAGGGERPGNGAGAGESASRPEPLAVAVLCRPRDALAVGGAVGLGLAARCRRSHAVVAVWGGSSSPPLRAPATAAARRLAARLSSRGHRASATGRLVVVALEDASEAGRVAAAVEVPVVSVLAGAREDSDDDVLRSHDTVLVAVGAEDEPPVAELALVGLAVEGIAARTVELPAGAAAARVLAASGVALLPPLRGAVEVAL